MRIFPKDFVLSFVKKEQKSKDAWTFFFDRTAVPDFTFESGQYIRMTLDIPQPDERGTGRFFTLASSSLDKKYVYITTRILQSAFKKTLAELTPGTSVKFFGPVGRFILNEEETMPQIFLAGGIGLTPFHSMLLSISEKKILLPVTLFVSFSTVEEVVYFDELSKIATENSNIEVVFTVTKPEESHAPWSGEKGRISVDLIKKYCPDFLSSQYYISGPPPMVDAMLLMVKDMGVLDDRVKKEKFIGY